MQLHKLYSPIHCYVLFWMHPLAEPILPILSPSLRKNQSNHVTWMSFSLLFEKKKNSWKCTSRGRDCFSSAFREIAPDDTVLCRAPRILGSALSTRPNQCSGPCTLWAVLWYYSEVIGCFTNSRHRQPRWLPKVPPAGICPNIPVNIKGAVFNIDN